MINFSKDVCWIFSLENPMSLPSYIVSGIMPADYNKIQKIIFLKNHNPTKFLNEKKPKVLIIGKAFHSGIIDLVKEAQKRDIKIISIFDDWHFDNNYKNNFSYNTEIALHSNKIVAKTKKAIDVIFQETKIKGNVIPDCIRYKTLNSINKINKPYRLCWFGTHNNHLSIIKAIDEISNYQNEIFLNIITNRINDLKNSLNFIKNKINIKFTEWSLEMDKEIYKNDIVIIPLINDKPNIVKSSNRIIDSLNMGRFVIINDNNQFSEFRNFCYFGNIIEGLNWISKNENLAVEKIKKGQKYVIQNYNLKKIGEDWSNLIKSI